MSFGGASITRYSFVVSEADIDLLLAEECECNVAFCTWLMKRVGIEVGENDSLDFVGRSIFNYQGESDLVLVHRKPDGTRKAVLIENKIAAASTERQAERYKLRGQLGITERTWDSFVTALVAPQKYVSSTKMIFDFAISYEEIMEALDAHQTDSRAPFKRRLLSAAIEKARVPWVRRVDPSISDWFKQARQYAVSEFPDLPLPPEKNERAPTSKWLVFYLKDLPRSRACIEIKLHTGHVDLRLTMVELGEMRRCLLGKIPSNADTLSAKKSCAIRISNQSLSTDVPFADQKLQARALFEGADTLRQFALSHRFEILKLLGFEVSP